MPEIEKEIPCPFKNHPRTYIKKRSPWHDWLRGLKPGDSFVIETKECQNVAHIARQVQVLLVLRHGPDEAAKVLAGHARLWRVPEPEPGQRLRLRLPPNPRPGPSLPTSAPPTEDMSLI